MGKFSATMQVRFKADKGVAMLFKLLLIEDDITLFNEIKERLTGWSYDVYGITDFSNVLQEFATIKPDCD